MTVLMGRACVSSKLCIHTIKTTLSINVPRRVIENVQVECGGCVAARDYGEELSKDMKGQSLGCVEKWLSAEKKDTTRCQKIVHKSIAYAWRDCFTFRRN
jgi:hypothetical protein